MLQNCNKSRADGDEQDCVQIITNFNGLVTMCV
jgi:hypothetical protein